jgi:hypothetical protein
VDITAARKADPEKKITPWDKGRMPLPFDALAE